MVGTMALNSPSWSICLLICILSTLTSSSGQYTFKENEEDRLYKDMMKFYMRTSRPVLVSNSSGFTVDVGITHPRLEALETATDTMTLSFYLYMNWKDERLQWNESEYGNLKSLRVPADSIWMPEMEVFNVSPFHPSSTMSASVIIRSSGMVMYIPSKTISFYCSLDLSKFPYDTQKCPLKMGPWTYSSAEQNLTYQGSTKTQEVPTSDDDWMSGHPQWNINNMVASIEFNKYACCPETYVNLLVDITVTRVASYYRLALVGPSIFLAILIPITFLLPSDQVSRTNFGMLLMLTMAVIMMVFQEAVSFDHATVPVLAVYYLAMFILQFFSILCCTFTANLRDRGTRRKPIPAWLASLCLHSRGVRRCLCLDSNFPLFQEPDTAMDIRLLEETQDITHDTGLDHVDIASSDDHFRDVANHTKIMAGKITRESTYEKLARDWLEISRCLDRIFFVLFVLLIFIVSVSTVL